MKLVKSTVIIGLIAGLMSTLSHGHGRYILPSHTMLSADDKAEITIQSSISNDVFHPDMPFGNNEKGIKVNPKLTKVFSLLDPFVLTPLSSEPVAMTYQAFNRFSVADLTLKEKGTHAILIEQKPFVITTFKKADDEPGREFGPGKDLPKGATDIKRREIHSRSLSYVSFNGISDIQPQNRGLEIRGQHPNDLFTQETAEFQLFMNGKPLTKSTDVSIIKEDTRHRNQRDAQIISTNDKGEFSVSFKDAGFYLLETQITSPNGKKGLDIEQYTLYLTLEVFPQ